jgi:Ca-activated chloride channel family protein
MSINYDDPKWTAYVLGELSETERAMLDAELESSQEAREFVQELRQAVSMMKEGLAAQSDPALTPEQRLSVQRTASTIPVARWSPSTSSLAWAGGLAAAVLMIATITIPSLLRSRQAAQEARLSPDTSFNNNIAAAAQQPNPEVFAPAQKSAPAALSVPAGARQAGEDAPVQETHAGALAEKKDLPLNGRNFSGLVPLQQNEITSQIAQADLTKQDAPVRDAEAYDALRDSSSKVRNARLPKVESQIADALTVKPAQPELRFQQGQNTNAGLAGGTRAGVLGGVLKASEAANAPAPTPPVTAPAPSVRMATTFGGLADSAGKLRDRNNRIIENGFIAASQQPLATFSVDVDTASYSNVRRFLNQNQWPPQDSVRLEEMINYFNYDYPQAAGAQTVAGSLEVAAAPWNPQHRLVRVGVKAKDVRLGQKPSNLVFLIDVSGSMGTPERLPLLKNGLHLLVDKLTEGDKVSIVTYAGASGIALAPISGDRKDAILRVIDSLHAEGNTNGGAGIQTAYELAVSNFIPGSVNRVILATDGDFNVGSTDPNELTQMIENKARSGVFLTVLGFGNNFKDSLLGRLAEKGHGNYAFIDTLNEARKVLIEQIDSTLVAVAKDVKVQIEFNPAKINAYRLLGYERRVMAAQDFNNDRKDANDMGSGQTVTALFEVVPRGVEIDVNGVSGDEPLRYRQPAAAAEQPRAERTTTELLDLRIRYKDPEGSASRLVELPLIDRGANFSTASADFRFASAVAGFGMILQDSAYKGSATFDWVLATARSSRGADKNGYREEFIRLVQRAMQIRR